ncbi:hypothetical protein CK218_10870 [Mesorhizobium sp. WSM3879]|uniref:hypothetical protein n=1 Tax=Mesorhizobium sp. WSM3879 TaxID=2029406 RepID=UPI000BAE7305|nr:hypothetical protein [Mesorhizobium sp. WSM3879]PBB80904.1 hypothetical protein CK218_10870 [Mesorhizobium sp. WSM3879]
MKALSPKLNGPAPQLFAPVCNSNVEGAGGGEDSQAHQPRPLADPKCAKSQIDHLAANVASHCCRRCGASLAGKRSDAKFCSAACRVGSHRQEVGRAEEIASGFTIDKAMRDALIESDRLNPQDEHDPVKVREAFAAMCRQFAEKYA